MIEAETKAACDFGLHLMHLGAISIDGFAGLLGRQLGGGAMLVGGTQEHHFVATCPLIARI